MVEKKDSFVTTKKLQSSLSVIMTILMVKNNQVQVCDDVLRMLFDGIYSTTGDVDYKSFHINLKSNHHDHDNTCELVFDTEHNKARDNNQCTTYQVHQSLFYIYWIDTNCDHDHMFLQCNDNKYNNMIFLFPLLWEQVSKKYL